MEKSPSRSGTIRLRKKNVNCVFILCWLRIGLILWMSVQFSCSVIVLLFGTPRTTACQASLFITNSWSVLKLMSMKSLMPSTISSSVVPFSHLQSFAASGSFPVSQFFASGGQRVGVSPSTSVLPMNIQDWFPLGWTGWISLQSKGLSRIFSLRRHHSSKASILRRSAFFVVQLSHPYIRNNHSLD